MIEWLYRWINRSTTTTGTTTGSLNNTIGIGDRDIFLTVNRIASGKSR